jgi:cysteine desulfurase
LGFCTANENPARSQILISAADHHCALGTVPLLERLGYEVRFLPVSKTALPIIPPLDESVLMVVAMHVNNELGTVTAVGSIASECERVGALFVMDAVASFGKIRVPRVDLVAIASHKVGGPKGAGALIVKSGTKLRPLTVGGGQERELRGGTENPPAIIGFGVACRNFPVTSAAPRDVFLDRLHAMGFVPTVDDRTTALSSYAHGRFPGIPAETLLIALDRLGISANSGAACSSGSVEPSHVMLACGYSETEAKEAMRFTFGPESTLEMAEDAADRVKQAISQFRA